MAKLFCTGATGYIGGDALDLIITAHPEYEVTCLVRGSDKGAQVAAKYAVVKLVYGDLDAVELIEEESKKADVVCHFAHADHAAAVQAIIRGLGAHDAASPGFLIHTSGAGLLAYHDKLEGTYGRVREKVYDDLEGLAEVTSLPDGASHRETEKIVLAAAAEHGARLKTAIVNPPCIHGQGRGPGNQRSMQIPDMCRATLQRGHAVKVNAGENYWGLIHVHDLSSLYLKLVEEAAAGGSTAEWADKPAVWGPEGYFFVEAGEMTWGGIAEAVAQEAKRMGYVKEAEVKSISVDEADELSHKGAILWGTNSRPRAQRARAVLKWEPNVTDIAATVKEGLVSEARRLGIDPGHAKEAAGDA